MTTPHWRPHAAIRRFSVARSLLKANNCVMPDSIRLKRSHGKAESPYLCPTSGFQNKHINRVLDSIAAERGSPIVRSCRIFSEKISKGLRASRPLTRTVASTRTMEHAPSTGKTKDAASRSNKHLYEAFVPCKLNKVRWTS